MSNIVRMSYEPLNKKTALPTDRQTENDKQEGINANNC